MIIGILSLLGSICFLLEHNSCWYQWKFPKLEIVAGTENLALGLLRFISCSTWSKLHLTGTSVAFSKHTSGIYFQLFFLKTANNPFAALQHLAFSQLKM